VARLTLLAERRGSGGRRSIDDFVVARLTLLAERRGSGGRRSIDDFVVARLTLFTERRGGSGRKFFEKKSKIFLSIFHPLWRIRHLLYIEREGHGTSEMAKNVPSFFTGSDGSTRPLQV
jgi:hypothetical protein